MGRIAIGAPTRPAAVSEGGRVTCGAHGETPAAFACAHLMRGVACGFHASEDEPADRWPDAWCDGCQEALQAGGGEWTEESEKVADIKLICTLCYEAARDRNRRVPPHARGPKARLTADEGEELIAHASRALTVAQEASNGRWGWSSMARWDFDDAARTLTFTDPARPTIVADVRHVGSFSTRTDTFQWAWETFDEGAIEGRDAALLRGFGEVRGLAKLTTPNWEAEEVDGWEMASLAAYLLGAEAVYRPPFDHLRWFMLMSNLRHV